MAKVAGTSDDIGREPIQPAWLSPQDAATYIGIHVNSVYRSVMDHVETKQLGRRTLINRRSLDRFMDGLPPQPKKGLRHRRKGGRKSMIREIILKPHT